MNPRAMYMYQPTSFQSNVNAIENIIISALNPDNVDKQTVYNNLLMLVDMVENLAFLSDVATQADVSIICGISSAFAQNANDATELTELKQDLLKNIEALGCTEPQCRQATNAIDWIINYYHEEKQSQAVSFGQNALNNIFGRDRG